MVPGEDEVELGRRLVDEIIEEEVAKLEGPECAPGEHVPFDLDDLYYAHCDRCERSLHREKADAPWIALHSADCRCATCWPERLTRGFGANKHERIYRDSSFEPAIGGWLWFSNVDGRAIRGRLSQVRRDGAFFDVFVTANGGGMTSVHRRYILRGATAPEGQTGE